MAALTAALLGLTVLKAGTDFAASQKAAKAVRKQGWAEASLLEQNAKYADDQAADAIARGAESGNRLRQSTEQLVGDQRAALAGQGLALGSGSAADIQQDSFTMSELDVQQIAANAAREAWGFKVGAGNYRAQAGLTMKAARNQAKGIRMGGYATLLTDGVNAALMGKDMLDGGGRSPYTKKPYRPKPIGGTGGYSPGGTYG